MKFYENLVETPRTILRRKCTPLEQRLNKRKAESYYIPILRIFKKYNKLNSEKVKRKNKAKNRIKSENVI